MKMLSKKIVFIVFLTLFSFSCFAQYYNQTFDASAQIPTDWIVTDNGLGPGKAWGINTVGGTSAHSQVYSAELKTGDNAAGATFEDWLITPAINVSSLSKPEFHFWARNGVAYNQYSKIQVRVSTVSQDRSTFTTVLGEWDEVHVGSTNPISAAYNTWAEKTIDLTNYKSFSQIYIAFVVINTGIGDTWLLDDISIIDSPSNVSITNITAISAKLSWDPAIGNPTMYEIELRKADQPFTGVRTAYINTPSPGPISSTYQANSLDYKTDYKFYVRAVYGTIKSVWSGPYNFKTKIFYESFDTRTVLPPGWIVKNNDIGLTYDWRIYSSTMHSHNSSARSMLVSPENAVTSGGTIEDWLITPAINMSDFSKPELNFWAKSRYGLYGNSKIEVRVSTTSQTDLSTFTPLAEWNEFSVGIPNPIASANDVYGEQSVDLSAFVTASQVYIAFVMTNEGNGDIWLVDDISVIDKPTDLTATAITTNSATLSWGFNGENPNYEIELLNAGQNPTGIPTATVSTNSYNVTGLNQAVPYEYYVRSVYVNAKSTWSGPYTFTTVTTDYSCPNGDINFSPPPVNYARFRNPVVGATDTYRNILATPLIPIPSNGQLVFFSWGPMNFTGSIKFQVRIASGITPANQTNEAAYTTLVQEWTPAQFSTTGLKKVAIPSQFWGQSIYISIVYEYVHNTSIQNPNYQYANIAIDDLRVVQECLAPNNLDMTRNSSTSVTLSWDNPGNATSFQIENLLATSSPTGTATSTSTTNSYLQNGLTDTANYKYYVRAVCPSCAENNSDWVGPFFYDTKLEEVCQAPTNLVVSNYNGTSADISWTPGTETSWEVFIAPHGESFPSSGIIVMNDPTYHFSGLDNEILYDVRVNAICGSSISTYSFISIPAEETSYCIKNNIGGRAAYVTNLFKNFIKELLQFSNSGGIVDENYQSYSFSELAPYITVPNPRIYNFTNVGGTISFSFSENEESNFEDVVISGYSQLLGELNYVLIDDNGYVSPTYVSANNLLYFANGTAGFSVKHINFCPEQLFVSCTASNQNTNHVKGLYMNLVNHVMQKYFEDGQILNGYIPAELVALAPYITDPNPAIYNVTSDGYFFKFSFSQHSSSEQSDVIMYEVNQEAINLNGSITDIDLSTYTSPDVYLWKVGVFTQTGNYKTWIKHVNFCPEQILSCTVGNPKSQLVLGYFKDLLRYLAEQKIAGVSDATINATINVSPPQALINLRPFITDANPGVYNFQTDNFNSTNGFLRFSFSQDHETDIVINGMTSELVNGINIPLYNYSDYNGFMVILNPKGTPGDKGVNIRHINFCPKDVCVNHVAIVLDESGSLSDLEKTKIRRQLREFVRKQAQVNDDTMGNMHISLIAMSDRDVDPNRTDHIKQVRITASNLGQFESWITAYGSRYNANIVGASQGSDFWNSGLQVALNSTMKPDVVIMITDGSQTGDVVQLKNTMEQFNNFGHPNDPYTLNQTKPHLYVIGIDNGFYVYDENTTNNKLQRDQDPNYVADLSNSPAMGRVTSALKLSLKYLLGLSEEVFPLESISVPAFEYHDYIGLSDFGLIGDDLTFLSDNIKRANIGCGEIAVKEDCDNCLSFKPKPGPKNVYFINAWAKEEHNVQVTNYASPKIKLIFKDASEVQIGTATFGTKGDIIEGWQRIVGKFSMPEETVFMDFELINESADLPVFFDDIRIYPTKGSMKSFVYDSETFKLMSELDENNYSTYYEYDHEGGLVRVKKETSEGIKTIQETRSGNQIKVVAP